MVTGSGTSQDPYVIQSDVALGVVDTEQFDLGLSGEGTLSSPWLLSVSYAPSHELTDLPDVLAPSPSNGQVLAWSDAEEKWVPAPPAVAAAGGVLTDTSLTGDGSAGATLKVKPDGTKYVTVRSTGVGLSDAGINALVRVFPDEGTRLGATPAPTAGTLSMVLTQPGQVDYFDGTDWQPLSNGIQVDATDEFLALSGSYNGGLVTSMVRQVIATTDSNGQFDVLSSLDLGTYAGVLSVTVTPVGTTPWVCPVVAGTGKVTGTVYRVDDGTLYAGATVSALVTALLY
jgi:hypothetical protein